jgi:hypothetical protein
MKTYRAIEKGFDGKRVILPGELFTTGIAKGSWMQLLDAQGNPVDEAPADAAPVQAADADKDARIAALEADLAAARQPAAPATPVDSGAGPAKEPGPLDMSIPDLTKHIAGINDADELSKLLEGEKAGKTRQGAIDAIAARIDAVLAA